MKKGLLFVAVIAAALLVLAFQNLTLVHEAKAERPDFNKFANVPINNDGSINVKLISDQIDVNIKSIGGSSVYGQIPVNLKEIGGSSFYGAIPVNIKELSGSSVSSNGIPVNIESVDGFSVSNAVPVKEVK